PGVLTAEHQEQGLRILRLMLAVGDRRLVSQKGLDVLASAAALSAVYSLGKNTTTRSNFKLPYVADETGLRRTPYETHGEAVTHLAESQAVAGKIVAIRRTRPMRSKTAVSAHQRELQKEES